MHASRGQCHGKRLTGIPHLSATACRTGTDPHSRIRPVFHRMENQVRAHVLLCMLAYSVEWHMRQRLASLLFDDEDSAGADAERTSVVAPARVSASARRKAARTCTDDGMPVQSFRTL